MATIFEHHEKVADVGERDTPAAWHCKGCGASQTDNRDGRQFCSACGRPRIDVEWSRRVKWFGLIVFGIAIQGMTGFMIFLVPPGASVWAWVVYFGMGLVGFLHMFVGIELTRRDVKTERPASYTEPYGNTMAEGLPLHDRRCPGCDHSLIEVIDRGRRICPSCGERFTLRQLGFMRDDPAGELLAASPNEARLNGGAVVSLLIAAAILVGLILTTLLATSGTGHPTPGP